MSHGVYVVLKLEQPRAPRTEPMFATLCQWPSVLSSVVTEQERMLPVLLDLLDTNSDVELRPLTGLLRNLARHSSNKEHMGKGGKHHCFHFNLQQVKTKKRNTES